jgi:hypothetical protein
MKTIQESNQAQAAMVSALEQVAELADELCRPDYSDVDNAIGRYLLETVRPFMPQRAAGQDPPTLRLRLSRFFGSGGDPADGQATAVTGNESEHARTVALDCVLMDGVRDATDACYEVEENESYVAVN